MSKKNTIHAVALSSSADTWAIQIHLKKGNKWFGGASTPSSSVYSRGGKINNVHDETILVRILIGENATTAVEAKVEEALKSHSVAEPEAWLGFATASLQQAGLVDHFDVAALTALATRALAQRRDDGAAKGVVEIDYEGRPVIRTSDDAEEGIAATKMEEKKKGGKGFWISHGPHVGRPNKSREGSRRSSWERQDDAYGGLM